MTLHDHGVRAISYDVATKEVTLVFEADIEIDRNAITDYVDDMTDGESISIRVGGENEMWFVLHKVGGAWTEC